MYDFAYHRPKSLAEALAALKGKPEARPMSGGMRLKPSSSFTIIISTAMMASSTSRPSAMISAPSVMRCRSSDIMEICRKH